MSNDSTVRGTLLERLREAAQGEELFGFDGLRYEPDPLLTEAADELERLQKLVARASEWGEPCGDFSVRHCCGTRDYRPHRLDCEFVSAAHRRAATQRLARPGQGA